MENIIVVGVDGSETADRAAACAAQLAADTGARLHIVTAFDESTVEEVAIGSDRWVISSTDKALQTAESVGTRLRSITPEITSTAAAGKPADVLIEEAERSNAKLIVVGNRRMQGIGRILGSVASSVAHNAPCDVYIVKTT